MNKGFEENLRSKGSHSPTLCHINPHLLHRPRFPSPMHGCLTVLLIALTRFRGRYCSHPGCCNHPKNRLHRTLALCRTMHPPRPPVSLTGPCEAHPTPQHRNGCLETTVAMMEQEGFLVGGSGCLEFARDLRVHWGLFCILLFQHWDPENVLLKLPSGKKISQEAHICSPALKPICF